MRALSTALFLCLAAASSGQAQSVNDAIAQLSSADAEVRAQAACTLSRFRSDAQPATNALIANLADETIVPHDVCREILGRRGYYGYLDTRGTTPGLEAAHALGHIGAGALEPLHAALRTEDSTLRLGVVRALRELEEPASVPVLTGLLSRETVGEIRAEVAGALGAIEDPGAIIALAEALSDPEIMVREQAAWALGAIESRSAVPSLIPILGDPSPLVRERTAWALGAIEDARAVGGLITLLSDVDPTVRERAAWALGSIGDEEAVDALIALMNDRDREVRRMATWALSELD